MIQLYVFAQSLTALLTLGIALFAMLRATDRRIAQKYSIYNFLIASWSVAWMAMVISSDRWWSAFWGRALHVPAAFIPVLFYDVVLGLASIPVGKWTTLVKRLFYGVALLLSALSFHGLFVSGAGPNAGFSMFMLPGRLYPLFVLFFAFCSTLSFYTLFKGYRHSTGIKKKQMLLVIFAYLLGYFGGAHAFLPVYNIHLPGYAFFLIAMGHGFIFYAIFGHGFLQPTVVIRRTILAIVIYAVMLMVSIPTLQLIKGQPITLQFGQLLFSLSDVVIIGLILSMGPFLYAYFVRKSSFFHEQTMAGLTHELKSPLATIQGAIEYLQYESEKENLDPKFRSYVDMISRNSDRLQMFVNDLLTVFKYSDRTAPITPKDEDLKLMIADLVMSFEPLAKMNRNTLCLKSPEGPLVMRADQQKLKSVVSNLLSNACKFTKDGTITVQIEETSDGIKVSVSDTGCGIATDELPYVFDRFFQSKQNKTAKGTGIGLSIAKLWVNAHGGKIWAESEGEGKGTTVTFTIPK